MMVKNKQTNKQTLIVRFGTLSLKVIKYLKYIIIIVDISIAPAVTHMQHQMSHQNLNKNVLIVLCFL